MPKALTEGRKLLEKDPTLRRIVEVIVEVLDPDVIVLFGSRARGDYDEYSDYDLLVLKEGVKPEERRRLQWKVIKRVVALGIYEGLDLKILDTGKFEEMSTFPFMIYREAAEDGVVIYERETGW